jgi:hypothetical protein
MDNLCLYARITSSESGANTGASGYMDEIIYKLGTDCSIKNVQYMIAKKVLVQKKST